MPVVLTYGGDTLELNRLQAQPFGYEGDPIDGLTYRSWTVTGHVSSEEWLQLLSIYESWRVVRFAEKNPTLTRDIGTTVSFSGHAFGLEWTDVPCWFSESPSLDGDGFTWLSANFSLVDAQGYLDVQEREEEQEDEEDDLKADNGSWSVNCPSGGSTVVTLTKNPDGYGVGPQLSRTALGAVIVQGPLNAIKSKAIEGYTDETGWEVIRCWYEDITSRFPVRGEWYPSDPPEMDREMIRQDGADVTRCNVSWTMWKIV